MRTFSQAALVCAIVWVGMLLFAPRGYAGTSGKDIFLASNCNNCHTVTSLHIPKKGDNEEKTVDLSKVGTRRNPQWLKAWLQGKETLNAKKHKKLWKGSDTDLAELVKWMGTLK